MCVCVRVHRCSCAHMCTCVWVCMQVCMCVWVCVLQKLEDGTRCLALPLCIIHLRLDGVSHWALWWGWPPVSPRNPSVSTPHNAGATVILSLTWPFLWLCSFELRSLYFCSERPYTLSHLSSFEKVFYDEITVDEIHEWIGGDMKGK